MTTRPLDAYLPIHRLLVDDVDTEARDLDFDGTDFAIEVDADGVGHLTRVNKGDLPVDAASFGTQLQVLSKLVRLHTTGATLTSILEYAVTAGQAADFVGTVIGKKRSSVDIYRADVRGTLSNNLPVIATLSGDSVTNEVKTGALAAAVVTIDASSNTVRVRVTGVAATDIDWTAAIQIQPTGVIV